jgi:hypothetical protein
MTRTVVGARPKRTLKIPKEAHMPDIEDMLEDAQREIKSMGDNVKSLKDNMEKNLADVRKIAEDAPIPDLLSLMASFERMLRLLEEKRAWPDECLQEQFDNWGDWPMSVCAGTMVSTASRWYRATPLLPALRGFLRRDGAAKE